MSTHSLLDRKARIEQRLFEQNQFAIKYDLDAMQEAVELLALPAPARHTILVGGTNGKGSTCSLVHAAALEWGLRAGLYTSPHLIDIRERVRVAGELAPLEPWVDALEDLWDRFAGRSRPSAVSRPLTYFELVTLAAWRVFADASLDVLVAEVGMGGRLDATNVLPHDLRAITGVSMDHMAFLGDRVEAIAREKVGIFRQDGANYLLEHTQGIGALRCAVEGADVSVRWVPTAPDASPPMRNQTLARALVAGLAALRGAGEETWEGACRRAEASARWPGRRDRRFARGRWWWLDGAHNEESLAALRAWWDEEGLARVQVVFGLSPGRDVAEVIGPLVPVVDHWWVTEARSGRAQRAEDVAAGIRSVAPGARVSVCPVLEEALTAAALAAATPCAVAGSLYLLGDVLSALGFTPEDLRVWEPGERS